MGYGMASNWHTKHPDVPFHIYDAFPESSQRFKNAFPNAIIADTPKDIARECDTVVTMLPGPGPVKSVYLDQETGFKTVARKGQLLIDSSTIDSDSIKFVGKEMESTGAIVLDAPVSGGNIVQGGLILEGTGGANAGTLTFMVGSPNPETFAKVEHVLKNMGGKIWDCQGLGNGQVAKLANNMLLGISMIGVSEAMNLGIRAGMNPTRLAEIVNSSSGKCWSSDTYQPVPNIMPNVPSSKNYEGGFAVKLMLKDLGLAQEAAKSTGSPTILGAIATQIYQQLASSKEFGAKDFSVVYQFLNNKHEKP
jgi:3-hydroxyisobutyrate dehydrogenase